MKISIACDHGGFLLKETVKKWLIDNNYEVLDFGCDSLDSIDYPDYGVKAARAVKNHECDKGIVICTTGIGMSIVANKVRGIRCALVSDLVSAEMTRLHNDTNMLALGAKIVSEELALNIIKVWLETEFEGGRHIRRVEKISKIEVEENE